MVELESTFAALMSVCAGGLIVSFLALVAGWNLGAALRGLLRYFGMVGDQ